MDYYVEGEVVEEEEVAPVVGLPALYVKPGRNQKIVPYPGRSAETWYRRQMVAVLMSRHLTPPEILDELTRLEVINPETRMPWTLTTIQNDMKFATEEWKKANRASVQDMVGSMLAELNEIKRTAWKSLDLNTVLLAIDREAKLLGLYAPTTIAIMADDKIKELAEANGLDPDELKRVAAAIAQGKMP